MDGLSEARTDLAEPVPIISTVTGQSIPKSTFIETLRTVSVDCLLRTVRWDLTPNAVASHILSVVNSNAFDVYPIASCSPDRIKPAIMTCLTAITGTSPVASTPRKSTPELTSEQDQYTGFSRSKLAIVGASGRFPHANSMDEYWSLLLRGIDTHELAPASRWDFRTHSNSDLSVKNVSGTAYGCWLHDAAGFDTRFFNMSPREAPQVDPAQRLALLCASEALEQAGIVPNRTSSTAKNRVGVYWGSTSNDWMETNSAQDIDSKSKLFLSLSIKPGLTHRDVQPTSFLEAIELLYPEGSTITSSSVVQATL